MPPDTALLRAELARHVDDLWQLEVVEAAEEAVRRRYLQLLCSDLAGLCNELTCARRQLDQVRHGDDLIVIMTAEELVCGILRQTTLTQRRTGEHIRIFKLAHDHYRTQRDWLQGHIDRVQRLISDLSGQLSDQDVEPHRAQQREHNGANHHQ